MNEWQPISTAPTGPRYIVVAYKYGNRWAFSEVFLEWDEWVDVHSDKIITPLYWMPLPEEDNG